MKQVFRLSLSWEREFIVSGRKSVLRGCGAATGVIAYSLTRSFPQLVTSSRGLLSILYGSINPSEKSGAAVVLGKSSAETGARVGSCGTGLLRLFRNTPCLHHSSRLI